MGSSASKPETKVFSPKAPVDYSASFLSHLENSQESDYTRAQFTESYIQERVAAELQKLELEAITKYQASASDALLKDGSDGASYSASNDKLLALSKTLQDNASLIKIELDEPVVIARQEVISCLKTNKGKALNCWDEVEQFKKLVHNL
ncbi:DUF1690-domain-containing protein [Metschnikowia bicuspidata var. bicuspidata NRRL YB-4993]|uniref:DUF1690-domain-containing protein n=1 Tax=Metschnikowia bicuspidata var. bicuspidata NRRL YB-4993 TaxID=869754 RepID=A0A1A0HGA1_9ASCO|nr:DUF1690-domain-containing protein [Metschnikowia bicuspidata var. bicuspidata NRRL YB-4993]OBA22907.1 DUF1690-domain-containing protein [Metschnikowia bicuspidata var. bicuspidata NRRL YB-4993]